MLTPRAGGVCPAFRRADAAGTTRAGQVEATVLRAMAATLLYLPSAQSDGGPGHSLDGNTGSRYTPVGPRGTGLAIR